MSPSYHRTRDYWFLLTHRPLIGRAGHVHLLQLEQFIRDDTLVTLHGPHSPDVDPAELGRETEELRRRLDLGEVLPKTPSELSHVLMSSLSREHHIMLSGIASRIALLEHQVMVDDLRHPEELLEHMFLLRHELVTISTMAGQAHQVFARMAGVSDLPAFDDRALMSDLSDRFERVRNIGDDERDFLAGVIDYYQTRTATKMTVAMERLAVLAAVTLPITALASIYGMNVIVNQTTHLVQLLLVVAVMVGISGLLLRWTKKQGWW
ncbi:MAG: CorA family divalent cation transporter [Actinomycetota bacterium]